MADQLRAALDVPPDATPPADWEDLVKAMPNLGPVGQAAVANCLQAPSGFVVRALALFCLPLQSFACHWGTCLGFECRLVHNVLLSTLAFPCWHGEQEIMKAAEALAAADLRHADIPVAVEVGGGWPSEQLLRAGAQSTLIQDDLHVTASIADARLVG